MMKSQHISLILLAASFGYASAQYDQSIAVEGKYVPEYITHERIGMFPKPVRFDLEKSSLQYSMGGVDANFTPQAVPIQATGWQSTRDFYDHRGYFELGVGSWLQSTVSAGYRFIDNRKSALGVRFQHNSTSLWNPRLSDFIDSKMWRYDEAIGLYGHHVFDGAGRLDAAFDYHLGIFDYYGFAPASFSTDFLSPQRSGSGDIKAPTQTRNDISARIGWRSAPGIHKFSWSAEAGVRYFGYRRFYFPQVDNICPSTTGGRETDVNLKGSLSYPTSGKSSIGLSLQGDVIGYARPEWRSGYDPDLNLPHPDTYGMVSLTPYYKFTKSRLNIMLGAKIDLAFNAGFENDRYGTFHIAPNVRLDFDGGPVKLYLYALGGSKLHTMVAGYENDYYQIPRLGNTTPTYTPLDAKGGLTFGPFSGFHAGFDIAFRTSRNQYFGGLYTPFLNNVNQYDAIPDQYRLPSEIDGHPVEYSFVPGSLSNLTGFSFGINTGYDAGRYFKIAAEGRYQHQNGRAGYFNGYDRPEFTASISAETNPWNTLKFKVSYDLRAMRMLPVMGRFTDVPDMDTRPIGMWRLPNVSMLNFGASYAFNENFNVWIQADNLLNRRIWYMPGVPEPGIRLAAGIGLYF